MRLLLGISALAMAAALNANPYNYYQQEQGNYYNYPEQYSQSYDNQGYGYQDSQSDPYSNQNYQNAPGYYSNQGYNSNPHGNQGFANDGYSNQGYQPHGNQGFANDGQPDIRIDLNDDRAAIHNGTNGNGTNGNDQGSGWGSWFGTDRKNTNGQSATDTYKSDSSFDNKANGHVTNGVDNAEVVRRIRVAVSSDTGLSSNAKRVLVSSVNGDVTLSGIVDNNAEKDKVESLVKKIDGVKSVKNNIQVRN